MGLGPAATTGILGGIGSSLGGFLGGRGQRAGMEAQAAMQAREGTANRAFSREQSAFLEAIQKTGRI